MMLTLEDFGTIFLLASFIGGLAVTYPALAFVLPPRTGERFSELYVLGPSRMAEGYPFNVRAGEAYSVYLGVGNHMGSSAYYALYVKLRDQTEPLPNSTSGLPSPLPPVYEYRFLVRDGGVWERLLEFSFGEITFAADSCFLSGITLNGVEFAVSKEAHWDLENKGFFFELFFELWIYDLEAQSFSFHDRFVGIWLNMTQ